MNQFKCTIDCDNAAFEGGDGREIARILRDMASRIEAEPLWPHYQNARDVNGNVVGTFGYERYGEPRIYRIVRFWFEGKRRTIRSNVTLSEAQAHCSREDTSSHSNGPGAWFDGYDYMKGCRPR